MARTRAKDYDDKRLAILRAAARVFADGGYDRTSMATLAANFGVSKALLYHYYGSKDALLFDIIRTHLDDLAEVVEVAAAQTPNPPEKRLRAIVGAFLDAYRDADAEHKVQIMALPTLPPDQQETLKSLERHLVDVVASAVADAVPALAADRTRLTPATMSLFGMLNWAYMWFRDDRPMTRAAYADMVATLFLDGARAIEAPPPGAKPKPHVERVG